MQYEKEDEFSMSLTSKIKIGIYKAILRTNELDGHYLWSIRARAKSNNLVGQINKLRYNAIIRKMNSFIPLSVEFLGEPCFPHGIIGIFISNQAVIGKNCVIFHHVTIGSNTLVDSKGYGFPSIGDNVYIGCGAKIIGNVKIGNNVRIGANCVVTSDIPDDSTVVLENPRIIGHRHKKDNSFTQTQ